MFTFKWFLLYSAVYVPQECPLGEDSVTCTVTSTFNCTFDDEDYCGYKDVSVGPAKWIRSKEFEDKSPGGAEQRKTTLVVGQAVQITRVVTLTCLTNNECGFHFMLQLND